MDLGPPAGGFNLGNLFLLFVLGISFYTIFLTSSFSPFIQNLAFSSLFLMILYAVLGKWFASKHMLGEVAFLGLGFVFAIAGSQIASALNLHLTLIPLSYFGPLVVSWNGTDITTGFAVFLLGSMGYLVYQLYANRK
jgi:hypothetical protein